MNWFQILGLAIAEGEAVMQDVVELQADQAVVSPGAVVTLYGHKYNATLHLDPVAGA